jgi:hypothetical protein
VQKSSRGYWRAFRMCNLRSTVGIMCFAALTCGSAPGAATNIDRLEGSPTSSHPTPLRPASGKLKHVFSIPFKADPMILSMISGIDSLTSARTSTDKAINIVLDHGVPYPTKAISVEITKGAGVDASRMVDPLRPPSAMPSRPGHQLLSTFKLPGRNSYLAAWLDVLSGESSLTVWDEDNQAGQPILVATSSRRILGTAVQPSMHGIPELTIVVWTRGRTAGDVVAGMYGWTGRSG